MSGSEEIEGLRRTIAGERGLSAPIFVDSLKGETREEIEREADELMDALGWSEPPPPVTNFDGGAREPIPLPSVDPNVDMDERIRRAYQVRQGGEW